MDRLLEQYLVDNGVTSQDDSRFTVGNTEYFKLIRQDILVGLDFSIKYICGIEIKAFFKAFGIDITNMELIKQSLPVFSVKDKTYVKADFHVLNNIVADIYESNDVFNTMRDNIIFGMDVKEATGIGSEVINWCDTNKESTPKA